MDDLLKEFFYSKEQLRTIAKLFCQQMQKGLAKDTHHNADIKCSVTYVQKLPTGKEVGKALALDLGDSDFHVSLVTLQEKVEAVIDSKTYKISKELMLDGGVNLFDYAAECLGSFISERKLNNVSLPLGFKFPFPCVAKGLNSSVLIRWTKGLNCDSVVGEDVGRLLTEAIERRRKIKVNLVAVIGDTVGTLISCAYKQHGCHIGLILDTCCNVCYLEQCSRVGFLDDELRKKGKQVVINCDWSSFGDNRCLDIIRTEYDHDIDCNSTNKGEKIFDKMISGMYLGEICRLIMLMAVKMNLMFAGNANRSKIIDILSRENVFVIGNILDIENDSPPDFKATRNVMNNLFHVAKVNDSDVRCMSLICEAVSLRSATLVALAIAILINRIEETHCIIGVNGFLYRLHSKYNGYMKTVMRRFLSPRFTFELIFSEDVSGLGAALVALTAKEC